MQRDLDRLRRESFDVLVVGSGITGACLAHDAALRGLSVALVDKGDFGSATSSASSKLLHGGIRYLQQIELAKVRESALESAAFQRVAPHLTRYVPFLVPTYRSVARGRTLLRAGMAMYALLTAGRNRGIDDPAKKAPDGRYLDRASVLSRVPLLDGLGDLTGAQILYESHMYSSERMVLAFVKGAAANGAAVANYVAVAGFEQSGSRLTGARLRDELTGAAFPIRARIVANAAGPWIPALNQSLGGAALRRHITRFASGAHIVTRPLEREFALALPTARRSETLIDRGGRHVFVIPWRNHSLIGTTNTPYAGELDAVGPKAGDVESLLSDVNSALPGARLGAADVRHAYAGLYPLTADVVRPETYQGTGHYQVVDHAHAGVDGLVSVLGAKYTTARRVAELGADLIERKLGRRPSECRTAFVPLPGGTIPRLDTFTSEALARHAARLPDASVRHLIAAYGSEMDAVVTAGAASPGGLTALAPGRESIEAEVAFAVEHELAVRLDDVIRRRTGLGTIGHPGAGCLERCAGIMGARLGWSREDSNREIRDAEERLRLPDPAGHRVD